MINTSARSDTFFHNKGYSRSLDGLRGVAILLVVLFHDFNYLPVFSFGWIGVDIFFVLSGFLITNTFLKSLDSPRPLLSFYAKRVLRIFPLYYLSLFLLLFILPRIAHDPIYILAADHKPWFWLFLQNWINILGKPVPAEAPQLHHLWSLALEEQYYLVWPWFLMLLKNPKRMINIIFCILGAVIVSRAVIWQTAGKDFSYYFFTNTRIEGLCVGSVLAIAGFYDLPIDKRLKTAAGWTLIFCVLIQLIKLLANIDLPFFGLSGYLFISLSVAILIRHITTNERQGVLSSPLLMQVGKISFGWYIFHWPLYLILHNKISSFLVSILNSHNDQVSAVSQLPYHIAASIICTLLSLLLAYGSYYGYEIYFLRLKKRISFSQKDKHRTFRPPVIK